MGLGEAVLAEAQDLLEDLPGERLLVAALAHALDQAALEVTQAALAFPGGHRPA